MGKGVMRPHLGKGSCLTLDSRGPFSWSLFLVDKENCHWSTLSLPVEIVCSEIQPPPFWLLLVSNKHPGLGDISTLRLKAILRASHRIEGPKIP